MFEGQARLPARLSMAKPACQAGGGVACARPDGGRQTRLRLVHTGLAGDLGLLHDDGWSRFLARLAAVTGGGEACSYPGEEPAGRLTALRAWHDRTGGSWAGRAP